MKKVLSGILASSLILSTSVTSFAVETTQNQHKIAIIHSKTLSTSPESDFTLGDSGVITGYTGSGGTVVIPSSIGGRTVYSIGANAFENKTNIESITMPSTLQRIESGAFSGCTNLRSVDLNEGLQSIGNNAFASTTTLSSVWIPSTVTTIGDYAFSRSGLTSVYVPATVQTFGEYVFQACSRLSSAIFMANVQTLPRATFYQCTVLEELYLGEGIAHIGRSALNACTSLQEITLPSTTKTIGEYAFYGCSKLKKLDFSNTKLETVNNYAFQNCVSLTEAIFPYGFHTFTYGENTLEMDRGQFIGCSSLVKVVLPSTVTSCYFRYTIPNIGVAGFVLNALTGEYEILIHPFMDCNPSLVVYGYPDTVISKLSSYTDVYTFSSLGSVSNENQNPTILPTTPPTLPTKSESNVVVPQTSPEQNFNTSPETDFVLGDGGMITAYTGTGGDVVIPSSIGGRAVFGIGSGAFQNKTELVSISMPSTVERIESNAFSGCTNLKTVDLNEGLRSIGENAFASTTSLSSIWFPSTVAEIGDYAFEKSGLTSVYLPATVRILGEYVFQESPKLASVIMMADIDTVPRATFYKCTALTDVYIREGIVTIGRSAFHTCSALQQITLPTTTKTINYAAFYGCSSLKKLDFSNTQLYSVDFYAFQNCVSLTEAIFPYGFRTFAYGETSLDTEKGQFNGCTSLTKVVLPSTIDTCYYYYTFFNYSHLNQPFTDTNSSLVVYGYPNTSAEKLASLTSTMTFSSLGDVSSENQNPTLIPTTPPTLPTAPSVTIAPSVNTEVTTPSSEYPSWATTFIDYVSPKIMPNISPSNYNSVSNRGLIAQSLYNMLANGETVSAQHSFKDVQGYETAIAWVQAKGIMNGSSETFFDSSGNVTREQFALILMQTAKVLGKNMTTNSSVLQEYSDTEEISVWATDGMAWAVGNHLMNGNNGKLSPKGNVTQVEVAVMLYNFAKL